MPTTVLHECGPCGGPEETQQLPGKSASRPSLSDPSETLILIANDQEATILRSCNGTTTLIGKIAYDCRARASPRDSAEELIGENRWSRRKFTRELIAMLEHDVAQNCPDCVVILANETIREDIRRVAARRLSYSLITTLLEAAAEPNAIQ
jgi:hypothetical protein